MSSNTSTKSIPVRRVQINDARQIPSGYSETPGGTIFSTTPGGTRIIYERKFLLDLKSSPLSQTPTKLPVIPGVTLDDSGKIIEEDENPTTLGATPEEEITDTKKTVKADEKKASNDEDLFEMDM